MLLLFAVLFGAIVYRWISLERLQRFAPAETLGTPTLSTPAPEPTATRPPVITGKLDTAKLFNGITLHAGVETAPGADAATERREKIVQRNTCAMGASVALWGNGRPDYCAWSKPLSAGGGWSFRVGIR